jgi:hypothetical protein
MHSDPVRLMLAVLKSALALYLLYLSYVLAFEYNPADPGFRPPFVLFVMDTINLFIHEAGHLFLRPFGQFVHVLGGSLVQVLLPLALVVVAGRQSVWLTWYGGFWTGESLVNVSVYIADAPVKQLRLIAKGLIHDWNWLLSGNLEAAEPLSEIVFGLGILFCVVSAGVLAGNIIVQLRGGEVSRE